MRQNEQLVRTARLLCAPPADVYAEIKTIADRPRRERYWQKNGDMEAALLERNEPLIDLALAQYGTDPKIVAQIFARTAGASDPGTVGLRTACLANEAAGTLWNRFPAEIIGDDETKRIFGEEEERDAGTLLANPRISDKLLQDLFSRQGLFAELSELRWLRLLVLAVDNTRIVTNEDDSEGPDLGHYGIQKSILTLVREAPTTPHFMHVIYNLLCNLDPQQVSGDGDLEAILARWAAVETKNYKDEVEEGYYTGLPFTTEFCCLIAALYGKAYVDGKTQIAGRADAAHPALRASFYGNGQLSEKDMKAAKEKDGAMFAFAALWNDSLFYSRKLRAHFEEEYVTGSLAGLYRRRLLQLKGRWPNMDVEPVTDWIKEEAEESGQVSLAPPPVRYDSEFAEIKRRFGALEKNLFWGFVILAVILYFRH